MFVGYDWEVAEEVNEELLKQLASEFGVVNHARIPAKFRPPFKKDEKTRPFGFVSFAHREDAVKMGRKKSLRAPGKRKSAAPFRSQLCSLQALVLTEESFCCAPNSVNI